MDLPERKWLYHTTPDRVKAVDEVFFLTVCAKNRGDILTQPDVAESLLESVRNRHMRQLWYMHVFLVMPDHVHGIVSLPDDGKSLVSVITDWKRYVKRTHNIQWQSGFFEHRLRSAQSREEKYGYILNNPVRAGLVEKSEDWSFIWRPE